MLGLIRYIVELCPEVNGQLFENGIPLANQLVERSLTYDDEELDSVYTDNNGYFKFPAKSLKSRKPGSIFHEPVVRIIIDLEKDGQIYNLWIGFQHGLKTPIEFRKFLKNLNADLSNEEKKHHLVNPIDSLEEHFIYSICL
ncbi:hypothetical protein CWC02_13205 [Pseudoalteromonas sp. S2721]|uniref:DUF6795 domain-containing protein n=1 Tax=Pseudoalteromonas sp. S2721 TaxID=579526 RepID=UPI00110B871E|nr:DUF6795 domain-containing protein [Pseudoalteromonas sp. S2721]TMP16871.1 hypothetical protein CWC02_13205 [Pseudoalteromonas sp. S2721]